MYTIMHTAISMHGQIVCMHCVCHVFISHFVLRLPFFRFISRFLVPFHFTRQHCVQQSHCVCVSFCVYILHRFSFGVSNLIPKQLHYHCLWVHQTDRCFVRMHHILCCYASVAVVARCHCHCHTATSTDTDTAASHNWPSSQ